MSSSTSSEIVVEAKNLGKAQKEFKDGLADGQADQVARRWTEGLGEQARVIHREELIASALLGEVLARPIIPERDWDGECFVFDNRIALDTHLRETGTTAEQVRVELETLVADPAIKVSIRETRNLPAPPPPLGR